MSGETVLVVEDEGLIALHLTELLEKAGFHVVDPVSSGEMDVPDARTVPRTDLILMDIGLSGGFDGIEPPGRSGCVIISP